MSLAKVNGIDISYEEHGSGLPIVFIHELAMDAGGWKAQVAYLAPRYRSIALNLRGFPPSSVPVPETEYSQDALVDDVRGFLDSVGVQKAVLVGHGTGGNVALEFAIKNAGRIEALALVGSGAGYGNPGWRERSRRFAEEIRTGGLEALRSSVAAAPQRQPFASKDPSGWQAFLDAIEKLSATGIANVVGNAVRNRPSFADLEEHIARLNVPLLVAVGDRDIPAFEASVFLARSAPFAALAVLPYCGHTLPLEEPARLNELLGEFLRGVGEGRWASWSRE